MSEHDYPGIFGRLRGLTPEQRAEVFQLAEQRWCWSCGGPQGACECSVNTEPERAFVGVPEELVVGNRREVEVQIREAAERAPVVVLDLSRTARIDSCGLGMMCRMANRLHQQARSLRICNVHEDILSLLDLCRITTLFPVEPAATPCIPLETKESR